MTEIKEYNGSRPKACGYRGPESGFQALSIPRSEYARILLENSNDYAIRCKVHEEIFANIHRLPDTMQSKLGVKLFFKARALYLKLTQFNDFIHHKLNSPEKFINKDHVWYLKRKDIDNKSEIASLKRILLRLCKCKSVFEAYVEHYVAKTGHALTFVKGGYSSLDVVSELCSIEIHIWMFKDNQLVHVHACIPSKNARKVNILFRESLEGGYFEVLLPDDTTPTVQVDLPPPPRL